MNNPNENILAGLKRATAIVQAASAAGLSVKRVSMTNQEPIVIYNEDDAGPVDTFRRR